MIDPRAIIDPGAEIADDVSIGPWSIVGPDVTVPYPKETMVWG